MKAAFFLNRSLIRSLNGDWSRVLREIQDSEHVSRHVYQPRMYDYNEFIWDQIFEFPTYKGKKEESVVWRCVCIYDNEVHEIGKSREESKRLEGKSITYLGFFSSEVGPIRIKRTTRGHSFDVFHAPEEGEWHAVITIVTADGIGKPNKNDNSDVRELLRGLFEPNYTDFRLDS